MRRRFGRILAMTCLAVAWPASATDDQAHAWVVDSGEIDPPRYHGAVVANGMIGITSAPVPFRTGQVLVNGAYDTVAPGHGSTLLSSLPFLDVKFAIDAERIERLEQVRRFRQRLDLRRAVLTTSFDFADKASITYELRALRHLPYCGLLVITVDANEPITIAATSLLEAPQRLAMLADYPLPLTDIKTYDVDVTGYDHANLPHAKTLFPIRAASARSRHGRHTIAATQGFVFEDALGAAPAVAKEAEGLAFTRRLSAGESYRFGLVGSTLASAHVPDPLSEAKRLTMGAVAIGSQRLIVRHEREWAGLWQSDISIEGDAQTQRDVRSMLYHLYSFIREGSGYSISPMGLSRGTNGYFGHIFWDADVWMMPALLALHPSLARSMLDYRHEGLAAARKRAAARGFRGALFPWEGLARGEDDTPSFQVGGESQHHISADVGIAAWNYYRVTQDRQWLRDKGYTLLMETADFWTSRVSRNGAGRYDIEHVVAADEYAEHVDNDAYTNAAAKENLAAATSAARILGIEPNPDWEHVRGNIPILTFPDGLIREHAAYDGEKVKQADVILLAHPLQALTDPAAIRRNIDYYDARTDHVFGPALTHSIYATLYQRMGMPDKALELFRNGYRPLERPPFGMLAECRKCQNPYFATGAGGFLQSVIYGFGGLEITDQGLVQKPAQLPARWQSLTLTGIGPQRRTFNVERSTAVSGST